MAAVARNPGDWFTEQGTPPPVSTAPPPGAPGSGRPPAGVDPNGGVFTPPAGAPPAAPPTGGQFQPYSDQALQAILHKYPPNNEGVRQAVTEIDRTFGPGIVKLLDHPLRLDKFVTPTGTYDTVVGAGGSNPSWGWMREGAGTGGAGGTGGTLGGLSGVGVTPQGMAFVDKVMGSMGAVGPLLGDPMAGRPITDDPSYQFRLGEGLKALERSAAARGTLLTGGAAKAMQRYAQDVASTEYANSYARRASEQGNDFNRLYNVGQFMSGEQTNQFNRYHQTANLGLNATTNAQNNASGYATNIGNAQLGIGGAQAWNTGQQGAANAGLYTDLANIAGQGMTDYYRQRNGGVIPAGRNPIPTTTTMPRPVPYFPPNTRGF